MSFRVVVHSAEEVGFLAEIPALGGCVSQGETLEETLANIRAAAEGGAWQTLAHLHDADAQLAEIEL